MITDRPGDVTSQLEELVAKQLDPTEELQELFGNILNSEGRVTIRDVKLAEKDESRAKGVFIVKVKLEA